LAPKPLAKDDEIKYLKELVRQQKNFLDELKKGWMLEMEQTNALVTGTILPGILKGLETGNSQISTVSVYGTWQQLEFQRIVTANHITIGFHAPDSRTFTYDLQLSTDGQTWKKIKENEGGSVGTSFYFETSSFKYLRLQGKNSIDNVLRLIKLRLRYFLLHGGYGTFFVNS